MERETEGAGRGGWGAGGPTAGVTTTLPLQGKIKMGAKKEEGLDPIPGDADGLG